VSEHERIDVVTHRAGDITVHLAVSGCVRCKRAPRTLRGPVAPRLPSIVPAPSWTAWVPIVVGVVGHPGGFFLVDAGMAEEALAPDYASCDPVSGLVYRNLLAFGLEPSQRIDRRLGALGIDIARLRGVVLTHRHADHEAALAHLPLSAPAYVGARDWPAHAGALPCRWPEGRVPVLVPADEGPALGAFPHVRPLTEDGRVAVVPLPGHSPGHLGLVVDAGDHHIVLAGDAAFSLDQIRDRVLAGIVEDPRAARRTLDLLADQIERFPTRLALCHDTALMEAFGRDEVTRLERRSR